MFEAYGRKFDRAAPSRSASTPPASGPRPKRGSSNALVRAHARQACSTAHLIIGVDRLDYSKGIPQRIAAFSRFIQRYPTFPQSRHLSPDHAEIALRSPRICRHATRGRGTRGRDQRQVRRCRLGRRSATSTSTIGARRARGPLPHRASVGLVTPLRDGMNLVAKEYVASQIERRSRRADPVALRRRGASSSTRALLVNPYDIEATAAMIARALDMPLERAPGALERADRAPARQHHRRLARRASSGGCSRGGDDIERDGGRDRARCARHRTEVGCLARDAARHRRALALHELTEVWADRTRGCRVDQNGSLDPVLQ